MFHRAMNIISVIFTCFSTKIELDVDQVLRGKINYKTSHTELDYNINLWALTRTLYCVNFSCKDWTLLFLQAQNSCIQSNLIFLYI